MPRGGRREGAGRKPGIPQRHSRRTKSTIAAMEASAAGMTPVDYLLAVMRNEQLDLPTRLDAAKAVAPYTNPRLASIDVKARTEVTVSALTEEERRQRARQAILEAFAERPLVIEHEPKVIAGRDVAADVAAASEQANDGTAEKRKG